MVSTEMFTWDEATRHVRIFIRTAVKTAFIRNAVLTAHMYGFLLKCKNGIIRNRTKCCLRDRATADV